MSRRHLVTLCLGGVSAAVFGLSAQPAYAANKKAVVKYDIFYDLQGGTQAKNQRLKIKAGDIIQVEQLLAPTKKGYTFTGWCDDKYRDTPLLQLTGTKWVEDRSAYATWKKIPYTITYVCNDRTSTTFSKKYYITTATFKHESPERKGYAFKGWYSSKKFKESTRSKSIKKGSTGDMTLYAQWGLKTYWETYLQERIPQIKTKMDAVAEQGESFFYITDSHISSNACCGFPAIKTINDQLGINMIVNCGDIIDMLDTKEAAIESYETWEYEMSFTTLYSARGNHENNDCGSNHPFPERHLTDYEVCQYMFKNLLDEDGNVIETIPDEAGDGSYDESLLGLLPMAPYQQTKYQVMQNTKDCSSLLVLDGVADETMPDGDGLDAPGYTFCYVQDNEEKKIRHIFLDTGHPSATCMKDDQLIWLQRRLLELDESWTVIIFQHQFFCTTKLDANGMQTMRAVDAVIDSCRCTLAAILSGHVHMDLSFKAEKGYMVISSTTDAYKKARALDKKLTARGTGTNRQAFDVVHLNPAERTIYLQRVGFGDDRKFTY